MSVLEISNLNTYFHTAEGTVRAVDGIDLSIEQGEIVGLVGESGSGKSVTARSVMQLIDAPGEIVDGEIRFKNNLLGAKTDEQLRQIRGNEISMIFQDPMSAFNPTQTVGRQLHDVIRTHDSGPVSPIKRILGLDHNNEYQQQVIEMFEQVGIPSPESRYSDYPHEFSGGMLQRAMIGMSLLCKPDLVIADEPTTALDVTIERQILSLFENLVEEFDTSVLWITHDLSVVSEICDRVVVMYGGKIMEVGPMGEVLENPTHPYTKGLLQSVPRYDEPENDVNPIEGSVPSPHAFPAGCRFADRCPKVHERCHDEHPPMYGIEDHQAACYLLEGGE